MDAAAFPPLVETAGRGWLVHTGDVAGELEAAGEVDEFTLALDGGQSLSVRLEPRDGQDVALRVAHSGGGVDVTRNATGAGGTEWVSVLLAAESGEWTLTVSGETGDYDLKVAINSAWEAESFGASNNGAPGAAQDLDASLATLAGGAGEHAAVTGKLAANSQVVAGDDFELAALGADWTTYASTASGRVRVTNELAAAGGDYALVLDRENMGIETLTEAVWTVDLLGTTSATLRFDTADFRDEIDPLPATFSGHVNGDGVAISADGQTWHTVLSAPNQVDAQWVPHVIDLASAAAQAGIALGNGFQIKFQQIDNNSLPTDGRGFDEISVTSTSVPDEDWYRFTLSDGQTATIMAVGAAVELYDGAAQLLASGATSGKSVISGFRDTTTDGAAGVYYVRAAGGAGDYQLVVLRDAEFDAEANGAQPVGPARNGEARIVLGAVDAAGGGLSTVEYVVHLSVDGLRGDFLQSRLATRPADFPNFLRLQNESGHTYNARTDYTHSVTLPNHTSMVTGRPVFQPAGQPDTVHHGWVVNDAGSIDPADTLHNQGNPNVPYIASTFDVVHDHGLSTAVYASKEKFLIYEQSYNDVNGAPDVVGEDNGRDKIDVYLWDETDNKAAVLVGGNGATIAGFAADLAQNNFNYSFVHLRDPDSAGHRYGWGTTQWDDAVRAVDGYLGQIFAVLDGDPELAGKTALILTTDHGGGVPLTSHGTASAVENYTIPVFVWGAGLPAGANLYDLFATDRVDPGASRPDYNAAGRPFRNGETGNLALAVLGLPAVPGSTISSPRVDRNDTYTVEVSAGDMLTIETATPADGLGEFINTLDPVIELLDPTGAVVAGDDNSASDGRNARLTYTAAMPGAYSVRVGSAAGSSGGIYVLSIDGATESSGMLGDLDNDGKVGLNDLGVLQQSLGSSMASADFSGDGVVDRTDAAIWTANIGQSASAVPPAPAAPAGDSDGGNLAGARSGRSGPEVGLRAARRRPAHSPREDLLDGVAVDRLMARGIRHGRHDY
jgi:hypothetical protein